MRGLVLVLTLAMIAAACGGGGDDDPEAADSSADDAETDDTDTDSADSGDSATDDDATEADEDEAAESVPPPTTTWVPPEVDVEPVSGFGSVKLVSDFWAYSGWLGQIDPDRYVTAPVSPPPPAPAEGIAPLTGLAAPGIDLSRPALYVKIGNSSAARPQVAINEADLVYVTQVEGGATRLSAVFHSSTPARTGPVRSGRSTDVAMLSSLNGPILAISGANPVHIKLLREVDLVDLGAPTQTPREYIRDSSRSAPYNLMIEPATMWGIAADRSDGGTPPAHFHYRSEGEALPASATEGLEVTVAHAQQTSRYAWDPVLGGWRRGEGNSAVFDADGDPIAPENVVIAEVESVVAGGLDSAGSSIPEEIFLGSGRGWVFTDGHVIEVTWTKPTVRSVATWSTADGQPVKLTPGRTWVELAHAGTVTIG